MSWRTSWKILLWKLSSISSYFYFVRARRRLQWIFPAGHLLSVTFSVCTKTWARACMVLQRTCSSLLTITVMHCSAKWLLDSKPWLFLRPSHKRPYIFLSVRLSGFRRTAEEQNVAERSTVRSHECEELYKRVVLKLQIQKIIPTK